MRSYKTNVMDFDDKTLVQQHQTIIIEHDYTSRTITLNNGGWFSKTTKDRLNSYLRPFKYNVFQKNFEWFVMTPSLQVIPYQNHMTLEV